MTFVSYAQNNEDVMLTRVFTGLDAGFYIDIGAQDPRIDSVTKAFYDRGWRGINVEPVEFWYQKLLQDRPRDINLRLSAGATEGAVDFFEIADTGLSTSSTEFARRHRAQGYELTARTVQVRTLDAICAEHGVEVVHFLKIDAEGAEADVLRGIDLARLRPWVILVEATEPNSAVSTHGQWESLLVDRDYRFVYDDGLNRFYLASEHSALSAAFATPPNVYDDFVLRILLDHQNHEAGLATHIAAIEELLLRRAEHIEHIERIVVERDKALTDALAVQVQTQGELSRSHTVVAEREARLSELQAELAERNANLSGLQKELAEREASLSRLRQALTERELSFSLLQGVLVEHEASLSQLRGLITEHEIEWQAQEARIALRTTRLRGSEQAVATLSRTLVDAHASRLASEAGWTAALAQHEATLAALAQTQSDFQEIISSRSWRMTSSLRRAMTIAIAARAFCLRAGRSLASLGWARSFTALASRWLPGNAVPVRAGEPGRIVAAALDIETPELPSRALPLSDDAEQILDRCPVLSVARTDEGAR